MTALDKLLDRLHGACRASKGYRAHCPACGGASRKLALIEGEDGRVLLNCFAGCSAVDVVKALGLQVADLFPARLKPRTEGERLAARRAFQNSAWGAALGVLAIEATFVQIVARAVADGVPLTSEDDTRLVTALDRIENARLVLRGR